MRIGIEVGGTFTDLIAIDGDNIKVCKVPSTPHAPNLGALNAIEAVGINPADIDDLVHGSTVATNAILERKGAPTAFIATRGFRDVPSLQRHHREDIFDLKYQKPEPIIPRAHCFEVSERIHTDGSVLQVLDEKDVVEKLIPALAKGNFTAVAICLVNAYANPEHELRVEALIKQHLPNLLTTPSTVVTQEFREYERAATTALSAYVQPVIHKYLTNFADDLAARGFRGRLSLMQSNGGRLPLDGMKRNAVTSILSGPAAGLTGAVSQLGRSGCLELLTFDMGGTSTDVSLVTGGQAVLASGMEIDGLPARTPVLDIATVGAGGGSIIWTDDGGMLRVGPTSAGANPGPASYGKGGELPTVTDALVLLGVIADGSLLGDTIRISAEKARVAFQPLATKFGVEVETMAANAIQLAVANIVRAIQLVSTERGFDPQDFVLVPFGGGGPLVAAAVAAELGISKVVVPPNPGVLSAYGLLAADDLKISTMSRRVAINSNAADQIRAIYQGMKERLVEEAKEINMDGPFNFSFSSEMRFVGQAFEIPVHIPTAALETLDEAQLRKSFDDAHRKIFLHGADDRPMEAISYRLAISSPSVGVSHVREAEGPLIEPGRTQSVLTEGGRVDFKLVPTQSLVEGEALVGPALVRGYTSTLLVPPNWDATIDRFQNITLTHRELP